MTTVWLSNRQSALPIRENCLRRRMGRVLRALDRPTATVSILVCSDDDIKKINHEFRQKNCPTNVLAFPAGDFPQPPGFLGDIVISTETIIREAKSQGAEPGEFLYFYLIHGLLHLLGHDHEKGEKERKLQEAENERLMELIPHSL